MNNQSASEIIASSLIHQMTEVRQVVKGYTSIKVEITSPSEGDHRINYIIYNEKTGLTKDASSLVDCIREIQLVQMNEPERLEREAAALLSKAEKLRQTHP